MTPEKDMKNYRPFFSESTFDWDAFHKEAAKEAMNGILAAGEDWKQVLSENRVDGKCDYPSEIAHFAIAVADELIKQLKKGGNK